MGTTPIPYQNPSWTDQARGDTQSANTPVPATASQPQQESTKSDLGYLDVLKAASDQMKAAQEQVAKTPPLINSTGGGQPAMPTPRQLPLQNASIHNLDNEHPTTRAGARNKAIGQIAAQTGQIVGNYFKKKEAEKTQQLSQDLHRTMELQQGIDEATQLLQQNPNDTSAKAQLQKNSALLGGMLAGKNGKAIAKAYDITFGPEAQAQKDKNGKKIEAKAMTGALKQVQQDQQQDRVKQFEDQQVQHSVPNPQHQQAQANLTAATKQFEDAQKFLGPLIKSAMDNKAKAQVQEEKDMQAKRREASKEASAEYNSRLKIAGEIKVESMRAATTLSAARLAHGDEGRKMAETVYKELSTTTNKLQDNIVKTRAQIEDLDKKGTTKDPALRKELEASLTEYSDNLKSIEDQKTAAWITMSGDPNGAFVQSVINGPGYNAAPTPTEVKKDSTGLLGRIAKTVNSLRSQPDTNRQPE